MEMIDQLDPAFGVPLAIILWLILFVVTVVSLRRQKVRRYKRKRRETYMAALAQQEAQHIRELKNQ